MSKVYMVSARANSIRDNILAKLDRLMSAPGFVDLIPGGRKTTFIKANYSMVGNTRHLRPIMLRALVEKIQELGGNPAVTDTSAFSPRGEFGGETWFTSAELMGYSELALGCERILANGYEGDDGEFVSTGGELLGGVEVARAIREAEGLFVVSHVTGHPLAGFTGALYNLGVECLNNSGKARVYQGVTPEWIGEQCELCGTCVEHCRWQALQIEGDRLHYHRDKCAGCGTCLIICPGKARKPGPAQVTAFQQRVAEASAAIVKTLGKKAVYLNVLYDITPQPDRYSWADVPFVPDIGIIASLDPVAVDAATHQLITRIPGVPGSAAEDAGVLEAGREKLEAVTGAVPDTLYRHAEQMGLGTTSYEKFR